MTHRFRPAPWLILACGFLGFTASLAQPLATFEAAYTGDVVANLRGGNRTGVVYRDLFDATLRLNMEQALGWPRTNLYLHTIGTQGGYPSRLAGDLQGINNIEAPTSWQLYEAWLQYIVADQRLSILAGLYDLNTEFDFIQTASLFINSSHGMGPDFSQSGRNGPSTYPFTALGVRFRWLATQAWYVQGAVLEGVPGDPNHPRGTHVLLEPGEGALFVAETGWFFGGTTTEAQGGVLRRRVSRLGTSSFDARLALGGWVYTAPFERLDRPGQEATSRGAYVLGEWKPESGHSVLGRMAFFGRFGVASARVNRLGWYLGAGAVIQGPTTGRRDDLLGVAVASAHNGGPFRRARERLGQPVERAETTLELTYLATLSDHVAVQGDVQYVINPDTNPDRPNALVYGLRLLLNL